MYKKISRLVVIVAIFFNSLFTINIYGDEYSINDLIEHGKDFDKSIITIRGEAIGEDLERGDYTWININDTTNAIGVYMTLTDANKVKNYGGFNKIGDNIEVKGTFNRSCSEHGGDMDIHSSSISILNYGKKIENSIEYNKIFLLFASIAILIALTVLYYIKVKR